MSPSGIPLWISGVRPGSNQAQDDQLKVAEKTSLVDQGTYGVPKRTRRRKYYGL
jgi:hypothetical protein